ncbi:MAG: hypothetical protein ACODAJ_06530 [Planctomycetota bacterium]
MAADEVAAEIQAMAARRVEASSTLIAVHLFAAGAEQVCAAIEAAGGYLAGCEERTPPREAFVRFGERYLPELGREGLDDHALADGPDEPLASCAELVYTAWRGGLLHDGEGAAGLECVDDKSPWMLRIDGDGGLRLNVIPFQAHFERGLRHYLADLREDADLLARAERRSARLAAPLLRRLA